MAVDRDHTGGCAGGHGRPRVTTVDLHWRDFMQKLADSDPSDVLLLNDASGGFELGGVQYFCVDPTPAERATLHIAHGELMAQAAAVISAAAVQR